MQSKESQDKECAMNNITCDHTPFAQAHAHDCKHTHLLDLMHVRSTCMRVRVHTAVDCRE